MTPFPDPGSQALLSDPESWARTTRALQRIAGRGRPLDTGRCSGSPAQRLMNFDPADAPTLRATPWSAQRGASEGSEDGTDAPRRSSRSSSRQ